MSTEDVSARYDDLDAWPSADIVGAIIEGQLAAVAAVAAAGAAIAKAVDAAAAHVGDKGRIVYVGAGTSGRVAVQDGAELMPTFDWPAERVVFLMAGGSEALTRSIEGAEDDETEGRRAIDRAKVRSEDIVIGVAASGGTPYTVAALRRAGERGALTIAIASNARTPLLAAAEHPIHVDTGGEVVAGSTRMKAGTAQKIVLNAISTALMIRLGRVHRGYMVDMRISNVKLRRRGERMVAAIAGCGIRTAAAALDRGDNDVKTAVLLARGATTADAAALLARARGNLRVALAEQARADDRSPLTAQPRIERIAKHVAQKVEPERQKKNGKAREYRAPRR